MALVTLTSLIYLTAGIVLILLGLIILRENVGQRINRITGIMMFFAGTGPIFAALGIVLQATQSAVNLEPFQKVFLIWEFFFPQMLLFSLVFPREIQWTRRHRLVVPLLFLPHLVHFFLIVTFSNPDRIRTLIDFQSLTDRFGLIIQPLNILLNLFLSILALIYEFHTNFFALVNLIYIAMAIGLMIWSYRRLTNLRLKKQVQLVLWGIRASVGLYAIAFLFPRLNIIHTPQAVSRLLTSIALVIGAGSIAWAIVRYQFLDIRLIIRRGIVYSITTAVLIGVYLIMYNQGKKALRTAMGADLPVLEISFMILALIFFQPILSGLERLIERVFMRARADYQSIIHDLSHDIMTTLDPELLQHKIAHTLKETMSLEHSALLIARPEGGFTFPSLSGLSSTIHPKGGWVERLRSEESPIGYDELSVQFPDDRDLGVMKKLNPVLLVPLVHRENLQGILVLGEKITKTRFTSEDMTVFSVLAGQAAVALENASLAKGMLEKQRMEEELALAKEIQKNLLPQVFPSGDRFELYGYNLPSKEVGGDYYDFIRLDEHRIGIAIGDIAGKGIPAALLMSNLQAALRITAGKAKTTRAVITEINSHITRNTTAEKFATFFYSVLNTRSLELEYTNAGHNYPMLLRRNGRIEYLIEGGMIIGVLEDVKYRSGRTHLEDGDIVLMYTDGITEALNPENEVFGEDRLLATLQNAPRRNARNVLDAVLEAVLDFTHGHLQADDLTLVVLKIHER